MRNILSDYEIKFLFSCPCKKSATVSSSIYVETLKDEGVSQQENDVAHIDPKHILGGSGSKCL